MLKQTTKRTDEEILGEARNLCEFIRHETMQIAEHNNNIDRVQRRINDLTEELNGGDNCYGKIVSKKNS